ncbi:MAG: group 1 glycosyl transferase, partial [Gammaproteobacteria bacterium]|nr:group 1 glycosyl transferase [Gammaproteobacteria bacterium]
MNKKVVHITSVHTRYDVRIFFKECISLSENGFDVTLISPESKEQFASAVRHKSLPRAKSRLDRFFRVGFHALILALREKADIYHLHDPELIPLGFFLKLFGKKVVFDSHENIGKGILDKQYLAKPVRIVMSKIMIRLLSLAGCVFDAIVIVVPGMSKDFPLKKTFLVRNFPLKKEFYDQDAG